MVDNGKMIFSSHCVNFCSDRVEEIRAGETRSGSSSRGREPN